MQVVINMSKKFVYSTDSKVKLYSSEEDIMKKLEDVLGDKFVEYRKQWDLASKFELETEFPLYMQLELHQICNLKCPMCAIGDPEANSKYIDNKHMDWQTYEKIILEGEKFGCPSLNPQGTNEPLLVPNFEDYIKFASQHGFVDIMMNSNATLLSEDRARKLLDSVQLYGYCEIEPESNWTDNPGKLFTILKSLQGQKMKEVRINRREDVWPSFVSLINGSTTE